MTQIPFGRMLMSRFAFTNRVERTVNGDDITFSGTTTSNKPFSITVKLSDANRWINGESIQNCFKNLDAEQREILMTGNDDEAWDAMFPPESISTVVEDEE